MHTWDKDKHSVGILKIDVEHQQLFNIINDVYISIINNDKENLNLVLLKMLIHVYKDNKSEDEYMRLLSQNTTDKILLESIDNHVKEHEKFIELIISYIELYVYQKKPMLFNIAVVLNDWVNNHIIESDVKLLKKLS